MQATSFSHIDARTFLLATLFWCPSVAAATIQPLNVSLQDYKKPEEKTLQEKSMHNVTKLGNIFFK